MAKVIPAQAVAQAQGTPPGRARSLLRSYHRALESGSYGSEEIPHDLTEEDRTELEDAIAVLHERYPDLEDEGPARPEPSQADEDELVAQATGTGPASRGRRAGGGGGGSRKARRRAAAGGFLAGSAFGRARARRALRQTGIPGTAESTTAIFMQFIGVVIGLSLAYLLLTNASQAPSGRSAIELLAGGLSTVAQVAILPLDPFRAHPELAQAQARKRGPKPRKITRQDRRTLQKLGAKSVKRGFPQLRGLG